ncbi:hypothetical protein PBI_CLEO_46 [Gordonia phage Cleo]|nr:hypothetical protein PBI_CLEO_46 [Gordonia phage Cleo]
MKKMILVLAVVFALAGCSTGGEGSRAGESQFEPAPTTQVAQPSGPISDDPTEETIIQGYIESARGLLDQGVIPRDRVTVELIQSELPYVDADQAEAIRKAILK